MPRELPKPTKKDTEFRSIFQHIQSAQLRRSPSELFAQHIVSIVHYIKGKVWSDMVLSNLYRLKITRQQEFGQLRRSTGHFITWLYISYHSWCCCFWINSFLFFICSSTLPILRHESKWAVCHVPKKSCRGRNDEAKKEPRNPQVSTMSNHLILRDSFNKALPSFYSHCLLTVLFPPLLGESMFPQVPLRGTLSCLRIWRRPATRWPAILKFDVFGTSKFETI